MNDAFTNPTQSSSLATPQPARPLSRQRQWQLKMRSEGRCWRCGLPAIGSLCPAHMVKERERQRRLNGYDRRSFNARSYIFGTSLFDPGVAAANPPPAIEQEAA